MILNRKLLRNTKYNLFTISRNKEEQNNQTSPSLCGGLVKAEIRVLNRNKRAEIRQTFKTACRI
jgi:hypothetical protein